jgi:hypothetical protein
MALAVIKNVAIGIVRKVVKNDSFITKIIFKENKAAIREVLPFRVKFTNVGITTILSSGAQPIGIAIIGYNNYIL